MSWVEWLKGIAERRGEAAGQGGRKAPEAARRPRKGGESYAKEWVKVLQDNAPDREPYNTYTWELKPEERAALARAAANAPRAKGGPPVDPYDSFTWKVPETDNRDDPWGLKKDADSARKKKEAGGVNPYDTGVFDAGWSGRFDQR